MGTDPKVVIITGASQGIGEGLVRGYLSQGYRVVANSRSIRTKTFGDGVLTVAGDVTDSTVAGRVVGVQMVNVTTTLIGKPVKGVPSPLTVLTKGGSARSRACYRSSMRTGAIGSSDASVGDPKHTNKRRLCSFRKGIVI